MDTRITFRAPAKLKAALSIAAKRDKRKLSNFIVLLLEDGLAKEKVLRALETERAAQQNGQQAQPKEAQP